MKRIAFFIFCLLLLLKFSSCITSLQPLVTATNIITADGVTGIWNDSTKRLTITKFGDSKFYASIKSQIKFTESDSQFIMKHYVISYAESSIEYTWCCAFTRINGQLFMNLFPIECKGKDGKDIYPHTDYVTLNSYSVAKVDFKNANSIDIIFLDGEWIKTMILEGKIKIKHEYDPLFDAFIITASSEEMNMFLEKYGDDKRIYDKEHITLNKVKENLYVAKNVVDK